MLPIPFHTSGQGSGVFYPLPPLLRNMKEFETGEAKACCPFSFPLLKTSDTLSYFRARVGCFLPFASLASKYERIRNRGGEGLLPLLIPFAKNFRYPFILQGKGRMFLHEQVRCNSRSMKKLMFLMLLSSSFEYEQCIHGRQGSLLSRHESVLVQLLLQHVLHIALGQHVFQACRIDSRLRHA